MWAGDACVFHCCSIDSASALLCSTNKRVRDASAVGTGAVRMSGGDACVVLAHRGPYPFSTRLLVESALWSPLDAQHQFCYNGSSFAHSAHAIKHASKGRNIDHG